MNSHEPEGADWNSAWVMLFAGWLIAAGLAPQLGAQKEPVEPVLHRSLRLESASPRELRRLPGIGATRAAAIAQARWERGGEMFPLDELSGIGEKTARRVQAWLEREALRARGLVPSPNPSE